MARTSFDFWNVSNERGLSRSPDNPLRLRVRTCCLTGHKAASRARRLHVVADFVPR